MSRHIDCLGTQLQNDLKQVMTVQTENRPPVGMDISDLLQLCRDSLRILKAWQKNQAMDFAHFSVLLINRADLPCYNKPRDHFPRDFLIFDPVFVFQHIEPVFRRLQFLRKFFPPCRMGKITGSYDMYTFLPCPQIQMLRCAVFARRSGISGVNM